MLHERIGFQTSLILIYVTWSVCSGISWILIHFCFPYLLQERRDGHCLSSRCSFIWRHSYVLFTRNPRSVSNEAVCGYGCRYTSVTQRCVWTSSKHLNKYSEFISGSDRIIYFSAIWFMSFPSAHSPERHQWERSWPRASAKPIHNIC